MARRGLTKPADIEAAVNGTANSQLSQEEIAARAYAIYEREGRTDGRAMDHWLQAEAELRAERDRNNSAGILNERGGNGHGSTEGQEASIKSPARTSSRRPATVEKAGV